jgi:hypothetical protein
MRVLELARSLPRTQEERKGIEEEEGKDEEGTRVERRRGEKREEGGSQGKRNNLHFCVVKRQSPGTVRRTSVGEYNNMSSRIISHAYLLLKLTVFFFFLFSFFLSSF